MLLRGVTTAGLLLLTACQGPYSKPQVTRGGADAALTVKVERVVPSPIPEVVAATGELLAEDTATVGVKAPGRVTRLLVDLGSLVRAGDVLAELERDDYEFRVRQAEALVEQTRSRLGIRDQAGDEVVAEETAIVRQAEAARREARFVFETTARLQREGVVSKIDFEKAQVRWQGTEAAYQAALEEVMHLRAQLSERRAQLALARQQLADCTIRAPFAGAVMRRVASPGEYLPVNAPVVTLVKQHPLRLRLEVPERLAVKVKAGQQVEVTLEGSRAKRTGRVVRLAPAIEAQSRSLVVEGEIPNQDGALRPGSFAQAEITVDPLARGIAVAAQAVTSFAGVERVFVVRDGALEERVVKSGRRLGDERVEIVAGLEAGADVVTPAAAGMRPGVRVKVN